MRRTKAQREYHEQMKQYHQEISGSARPQITRQKARFKDTKLYYYGIRLFFIIIFLTLASLFDNAVFNIVGYFR